MKKKQNSKLSSALVLVVLLSAMATIWWCVDRIREESQYVRDPSYFSSLSVIPGNQDGVWVDFCNDIYQPTQHQITTDLSQTESLKLDGWAADMINGAPFGKLFLQVGDVVIPCAYGAERQSVVDVFQNENLRYTGYSVVIPGDALQYGAVTELQFIGILADDTTRYEDIPYHISYTGLPDTPLAKVLHGPVPVVLSVLAAIAAFGAVLLYFRGKGAQTLQRFRQNQFLFSELVKRDFTLKYKRTVLGMFWSILAPLINLLIMWVVFNQLLGNNIDHFVLYLFAGQLVFTYFSDTTSLGMTSLLDNAAIFTKVNVPKYLFLFSRNVSALINFVLTLVIFFVFVAVDGVPFTGKFIMLLYPVLCLVLLNLGVGMILSALFMFFRDMQYLWGLGTQVIMWLSAIFYSIDMLEPELQTMYLYNPIYLCITYFRQIVIDGVIPTAAFHLLMAVFSLGFFAIGCYIYKKKNHEFLYYV